MNASNVDPFSVHILQIAYQTESKGSEFVKKYIP